MKQRRCKNTVRKGRKFEWEVKALQEGMVGNVLIARQTASKHPDLICIGEKIKLVECKKDRIDLADVKKMKWLIRSILRKQPFFIHFIVGEIHSPDKVLYLKPVINFPLREDYEFFVKDEPVSEEEYREHKRQKGKPTRRR
ncbi:hypothetical protein KAX97_06815 [candidate division WOR-3 bacterium]|nr:hypothetical protein [candidate division WOR-3 bacterium]